MPFARPSLTTLITRIESDITTRLTGGVALLRRALLKILARVWAGACHTIYGYLDYLSIQVLPDKAVGEFLDRHATCWGLARIAATFAEGDVIFTGVNGTLVPAGTIVVRSDGVEFVTETFGIIALGSVTLNVIASESGEDSNTDAAVELTLLSPIVNIDDTAVVDSGGIAGGVGQEADESLRTRILLRIKNPPAGGSESDYTQAALSVSGVANAFVFPHKDVLVEKLGHVTIVVLGESPKVPGAGILINVQNAADAIKPVTATIHAEPIDGVDIDMGISISPYTSDIQTAITNAITELYDLDGFPGGTILITHIQDAIMSAGVDDYEILTIDVDGTPVSIDDIVLSDYEYPIVGVMLYSAL